MAEVRLIRKADLTALEPLLQASFGQTDFDLQDEVDTFDEARTDWFMLLEPEPQGFIRYFSVVEGLYVGELYAAPGPRRAENLRRLLEHFLANHHLPPTARLRLDTPLSDTVLSSLLSRILGATTKTFVHYRISTPAPTKSTPTEAASFGRHDLEQIQAILGVLKPYSLETLERLGRAGALLAVRDGDVKAALHVEPRGAEGLEVVTLATDPDARRRGYASALLRKLFTRYPDTTVFLKVETSNVAAPRLYERAGFARDERKTEVRWYLPLGPLS